MIVPSLRKVGLVTKVDFIEHLDKSLVLILFHLKRDSFEDDFMVKPLKVKIHLGLNFEVLLLHIEFVVKYIGSFKKGFHDIGDVGLQIGGQKVKYRSFYDSCDQRIFFTVDRIVVDPHD